MVAEYFQRAAVEFRKLIDEQNAIIGQFVKLIVQPRRGRFDLDFAGKISDGLGKTLQGKPYRYYPGMEVGQAFQPDGTDKSGWIA